jgi:phosphonate transport system substrate-binding protein
MMARSPVLTRRLLCFIAVVVLAVVAAGNDTGEGVIPLNMAMTSASLGHVRDVDAIAAFKTYATEFAKARNLRVKVEVTVFERIEDLRHAAVREQADILGLLTHEYLELEAILPYDLMYAPQKSGKATETYVLLVHADSGLHTIEQLEGTDLVVLTGTQMGMARTWLDTQLMESGQAEGASFFRNVRNERKPSQAVLPVFFRTADASLVTESAYQTIVEMNPQVGRDLRVLAFSPSVIPFVACFRSSFTGYNREETEKAYLEAHLDAQGQQILMLFRFDGVVPCTSEDLTTARRIMRTYERLKHLVPPA